MRSYDINKKILDKLDDIAVAIYPEIENGDSDSNHTRTYDNDDDYLSKLEKIETAIINGGGSKELVISELCCLHCYGNANIEIPTRSSMPTYNNYSQYLTYNTTTRKFEVISNFTAILTGWVRNYDRASSTFSEGSTYINNTRVLYYQVTELKTDSKKGATSMLYYLKPGDTIYPYTPSRNGYPEQHLKIYMCEPSVEDGVLSKVTGWSDEGAT